MSPEPNPSFEIPRVGRDVGSQCGPANDAYQAAGDADRSVMALVAKFFGLLFMAGFGVTLMVVVGYGRAGWAGVFIPVAVIGMILTIVCRSK